MSSEKSEGSMPPGAEDPINQETEIKQFLSWEDFEVGEYLQKFRGTKEWVNHHKFLDSGRFIDASLSNKLDPNMFAGEFYNETGAAFARDLIELAKTDGYPEFKIEKYQKMLEAREGYIITPNNTLVNVFSEEFDLIEEAFNKWLKQYEVLIKKHFEEEYYSKDKNTSLGERIIPEERKFETRTFAFEASMDYPTLSHGGRVNLPERVEDGQLGKAVQTIIGSVPSQYMFQVLFYVHGDALPGKTHCNADLVSLLKTQKFFKDHGIAGYVQLSNSPVPLKDMSENEKAYYYFV
jgi:hypothetical protein